MIVVEGKKPIPMNHMVHSLNHTQVVRCCMLNGSHMEDIQSITFEHDKNVDYLPAGIYKTTLEDGLEYAFDLYYPLLDSPNHFLVKNNGNMYMVINSVHYPVIPYRILPDQASGSSIKLEHSINDNVSMIMLAGKTVSTGTPSLDHPIDINRIENLDFKSTGVNDENTLSFPLKYHLGKLPNGTHDILIINSEQMVCHVIMRTAKEILSAGLDWNLIADVSNERYYVFFAEYNNVKRSDTADGLRCTHFNPVSIETLLNSNGNYIAVSNDNFPNGICIKIDSEVLDIHGDKNVTTEFKKWLASKATGDNPLYIEYETNNVKFHQILLDEYHIKSYYPETTITLENNYDFSIFYKGLI